MQNPLGAIRAVLAIGWVILSIAAWQYAALKNIPAWIAAPVAAAFLLEFSFYLVPGFATLRERLRDRLSPARLACFLAISALLPYLVYALGTRVFQWWAALSIFCLALGMGFASAPAVVAVAAAVMLSGVLAKVYLPPMEGLDLRVLGQLMLIRTAAGALILLRRLPDAGYGFWPNKREWRIGLVHYLGALAVLGPLAWAAGLVRFRLAPPWYVLATFFGILWVVALGEEFLFRGVLQRALGARRWLALSVASLAFGAVHLGFRSFPNWKFAALAAVAGVFYGLAYERAGSIRASMVTHALTVATWRGLSA